MPWLSLGPSLAALHTSGFVDDVMFSNIWPYGTGDAIGCKLQVTHQMAARIWYRDVHSNWVTAGQHKTGEKYDVYDFRVLRSLHWLRKTHWIQVHVNNKKSKSNVGRASSPPLQTNHPFPLGTWTPSNIPTLDRPHSPPQTASRSNQPFCHSKLSVQTDRPTHGIGDRCVPRAAYA